VQDVLDRSVDHATRLDRVHLALVHPVRHVLAAQPERPALRVGRREHHQLAPVEVVVRERDQRFMARAVVPAQRAHRVEVAAAHVEDALGIGGGERPDGVLTAIVVGGVHPREERRRRQLLRVTDHHQLRASGDGADRFLGPQLRGLVHHDDVEVQLTGLEELGHRLGAHHEARLQLLDRPTGAPQHLAHGHPGALLRHQVPQQLHLGLVLHPDTDAAGGRLAVRAAVLGDLLAAELDDLLVDRRNRAGAFSNAAWAMLA